MMYDSRESNEVFFFFSFGSSDIFLMSYSFYYIVDFSIIFKQKCVS